MKWYRKWLWRRNRLLVWKRRLATGLQQIMDRFPLGMPVELHVSWGPFFNGCASLNRRMDRAAIHIQIPRDGYLTADDQCKLREYQISIRHLPLFIIHHEYYHLLDVRSYNRKELGRILSTRQKQTEESLPYYRLPFEEQADLFALANCGEKIKQAC